MDSTHGFELLREQSIPEINSTARLFRHQKTGAELLSVENDDENKVFAVNFCTPPTDSTGVPHILEHSVLCGSRKYPVKEPFIELLKGSLNTFVNAWTFPDKTGYPLASQNLQDFYNLIDVYLDAVFYPAITPQTLQQEGWHYELDNPDEPLSFKGVVYNEMKGAYADPDNLIGRYIQQSLFPDTTYGVDSGGDPAEIPNLTYEQFKRFHETYYHPSNARFFFYGDDPAEERRRIVNEYLKEYNAITVDSQIALQSMFEAPKRLTYPYAVGQDGGDSRKAIVTVNWLLAENGDLETVMALTMLSHILVGTPASPLRKALFDSGLGEDLAGLELELDLRQIVFSTGLKGVEPANADRVEALVIDTLSALEREGIDPDMVEAAVNTIEFALRENNTGSFPRGLLLMIRALRTWLYGGDPIAPLAFEAPLAAVKRRLTEDRRYFEAMIGRYLSNNPHRTTVLLKPDPELQQQQEAAERARLDQARAAMSTPDVQRVIEDVRALRQRQETPDSPEALATIPVLKLEDLGRMNKLIPSRETTNSGARLLVHDLFTNGIVYLDLGFNLRGLPAEYLSYVPLFFRSLLELGTETEDYVKLAQRIGRKTGGIRADDLTSTKIDSGEPVTLGFLRGKATTAQAGDLLAILRDVLLTVKLDNPERFRQLVLEEKAGQEAALLPHGAGFVRTRLYAQYSEADWAADQMGGIGYLLFLRGLAEAVDRDWPSVLGTLEALRRILIGRNAAICNVTLDAANWAQFEPELSEFLAALPAVPFNLQPWNLSLDTRSEGLSAPTPVNYVGKGANLYALGYREHGSAIPIMNYLQNTWLWDRVRVHGGAYGVYALFDRRSGAFTYVSYRDPNLKETLDTYDKSASFLRELDLSDEERVKAIISAIGLIDAYQLPDAKGYTSMVRTLTHDPDERRQQMREEVLATTADDFRALADVLDQVNTQGSVVVLGSAETIEQANRADASWLRVTKVL